MFKDSKAPVWLTSSELGRSERRKYRGWNMRCAGPLIFTERGECVKGVLTKE